MNFVISFLVKLPIFNRLIPSISIKIIKIIKKNRGFFKIGDIRGAFSVKVPFNN